MLFVNLSDKKRANDSTTIITPDGSFHLELRNLSGVPVLDVVGEINKATVRIIERTAIQLVRAGHYNLVLNLQKAVWSNTKLLCSLGRLVREVKKHYGGVTLVTGLEQMGQRISEDLGNLFRLCPSEADALVKIKRLTQCAGWDMTGNSARLAE